jgi:exonuclease SbcD
VPFLRPSELRPGADLAEAVGEIYGEVVAAARERQRPGDALLAMGHCYMVAGQVSEGSERKIQVGNQVALPLAIFPDDLDYVALGHLHLAQRVGGREHVRYAGAPLPLAMDERAYPHAVTLVELEGGRFVGQRQLRLPRARALVRLPERGGLPLAEALAAVAALPPAAAEDAPPQDDWPLVELAVSLDAPEPTLKAQVRAALRGRAARLVRLGVVAGGTGGALVEALAADGEPPPALDALSPAEVFARCWASAHAQPPEAAVQATFAVLEQLAGDPEAAQQARAQRLAALKEAWT